MTKLEQAARAMYLSIPWGAWSEAGWEYAPAGLRRHYLVQAAVAIKALRLAEPEPFGDPGCAGGGFAEARGWNAGIDAILNELVAPERSEGGRVE